METINEFNVLIAKFENNVNNYVSLTNTVSPKLADNVGSIRSWVDEQRAAADEANTIKNIENVENVVKTSIAAINDLKDGKYMEAGLAIVSSVATLVGGPYGALAGAMCGILSSVLSAGSPSQPDLATQLTDIVRDELKKFNQTQKAERLAGLQARVRNINIALKNIKDEASDKPKSWWWLRGQSKNPSKDLKIPDEDLFFSDFPQFIGEVGSKLDAGLPFDSKESDVKDSVASIVSYCNAQASYIILLTNVLATFEMTGHNTKTIVELLETQKGDARKKLGTHVDGGLPNRQARINMIYHLRGNVTSYEVVEAFRVGLGMSPLPDLDEALGYAIGASCTRPEDITDNYPQPQTKGDNHYFQLINHTDYPVKIYCGTAGDHINGLKFKVDVKPRSSYEHAATESTWTFSTAGYFFLYLDGKLRSFDNPLEGRNWRLFEFALSNPFVGFRKTNVLDKSTNTLSTLGKDCWNQMKDKFPSPIYFSVGDNQHYIVYSDVTPVWGYGVKNKNPPGNNGCETWRFVVQKYEPDDANCTIL